MPDPRLRTKLPRGVVLRDPLLLASGCCGYGEEYAELFDPGSIGGVITKAVSPKPRAGNPTPRLHETPAGLLNCIGLQNPGAEAFISEIVPRLVEGGVTFIVNVVGESAAEFGQVIEVLEEIRQASVSSGEDGLTVGLAGYELDLSCPNVESGTQFATDEALLRETVSLCRARTEALVIAKLSPNVTNIAEYAGAAQQAGADAVTIANTWCGVAIDTRTRRSQLARPSAGLSGAAIRPATLYQVWRCHRELPELPILGSGGITDTDSAVQYLLAGATALQLGTGLFLDPLLPLKLQDGLTAYLDEQGEAAIASIVGVYRDEVD